MASEPKAALELAELVQRMQHLKAEHSPLLTQIEGDPGMASDVRQALVSHLNEEEEELIAKIALISPAAAAQAAAKRTIVARPTAGGLTVGSLRQTVVRAWPRMPRGPAAGGAPSRATVGSASRRSTTTVGSLRRR